MGNKSTFRQTAEVFGIAESTVFKIVNTVMDFLVELAPRIIKFPTTTAGKEALAEDFQKVFCLHRQVNVYHVLFVDQLAGIPNVIGCVDGCYMPMVTPAHKIRSTYTNRHDQISMSMQRVSDAKRRYLDVFVGCPSKIHDARIFKMSWISEQLPIICAGRFHILGDGAYPLRECLNKPYRRYELTTPARRRLGEILSLF